MSGISEQAAGAKARSAPRQMGLLTALVVLALSIGALMFYWSDITVWAAAQQQIWQREIARAVNAIRTGDLAAAGTLIGACLTYGVVHAIGPGHGKLLIGGAALTSHRTAWRMATIGLAASIAQAISAIVIIYGGLGLLSWSSSSAIGITEGVLTPLSYAAIALVGLWIAWRGARLLWRLWRPSVARPIAPHVHDGACAAGCRHAPTATEAERVESWRDVAALIASIGVRPCSGALIVLVIAWRFELYAVGALSAIAMALGTGTVVAATALAATSIRDAGGFRKTNSDGLRAFGWIQLGAGVIVAAIALILAFSSLTGPTSSGVAF